MSWRFAGLACLAFVLVVRAGEARAPRCYGAASRDPEQACANPALRHRVTPSPEAALLRPDGACEIWHNSDVVCELGTPAKRARGTIAVLGDSHAAMWRAAVAGVARARRLHVWSLTKPGCAFNFAKPDLPEQQSDNCAALARDIVRFVAERPEIATVFVGGNAALHARTPDGGNFDELWIQGYVDAWDGLPPSVTRVVVLRDPFRQDLAVTPDCVTEAHRQGRDAGVDCAVLRARSLLTDPAVVAAGRAHRAGLTVDVADLTPFMCGTRRCFPVVGGVLVLKDADHLTQAFSATLGPYLLRAFDRPAGQARMPRERSRSSTSDTGSAMSGVSTRSASVGAS
jgi:hypothetical protein